jgi:heat shock protein HslJ
MKIDKNLFLVVVALIAGLFVLAACASSTTPPDTLTTPLWNLSTLGGQALVPDSYISAQFSADGKVGGASGCNQYSGTYTISGSQLEIASPLATTMMACSQALMDQESAYLKALGEVKSYVISGDQLTLKDANDQDLLVYTAQSQELSGTSWQVVAYNNGQQAVTSVLAGSTLTMQFGEDGVLSGNGGCNNYNGTYTVDGDKITIGALAATRMACSDPAGVMEQETLFLTALQTAATYKIAGNQLEMRTVDGALAVDAAIPTAAPAATENPIINILWQWTTLTNKVTGETTTVPNPEKYTLIFYADGTLTGQADCNNFSGTYTQDSGLVITLGASTMAFCGDDSLDQVYLSTLGSVVAGGPDGAGGLALENAGGEKRMLFQNGGYTE